MSEFSVGSVREFLVGFVGEKLAARGYSATDINDDFDLLLTGVIDSLAFLEMTVALQEHFEVEFDFDDIDPVQLSIVGPLCSYVSSLAPKESP